MKVEVSDNIWQNQKLYFENPNKKISSVPCIFNKNIIMSYINTSTGNGNDIIVKNTEDIVPFFMMN